MIILARHGRTAANAGGLLQGRADNPLDQVGLRQAAAIAASLASEIAAGARVVSSPLLRARATADAFGTEVAVDEAWLEADYGSYDGLKITDVPPQVWQQWRTDVDFRPPGGETLREVSARVGVACQALIADPEQTVIITTHVGAIKAAVAWALGVGPEVTWRMRVDQASIHRIGSGPAGPSLLVFNDTAHLRSLL